MIAYEIFCNRHEFRQDFVTHIIGYIAFLIAFITFIHFVGAPQQNETEDVKYPFKFFYDTYAQENKDETQYNSSPDPPCQCTMLICDRYTECGKYSDKYK